MNKKEHITWEKGPWKLICLPHDGARLHTLSYESQPLLTGEPEAFSPPDGEFGDYERRPVYGYDDCFPTVDQCDHPQTGTMLSDHGELCWRDWQVRTDASGLTAEVKLPDYPLRFQRRMIFTPKQLNWQWQVDNPGAKDWPFLHVMHPLLPLDKIARITLPAHASVLDEDSEEVFSLTDKNDMADFLIHSATDRAYMLLLENIKEGRIAWQYTHGLKITSVFSPNVFPTVGIWWNRRQHPPETGKQRNECALEPIPAAASSLEKSFKKQNCMTVTANSCLSWRVTWEMESAK